ncbi:LysR family transcriptional regulator [Agitococcus lubricus]|uniref:LysR family transcriptional regulator n=1 Tax=Agitococcus lubricus TaxID=1077255 RepID=A0A2T5IYG9_9GAMM|nr:LysR family transcriptional regulator [Agitococcus lubricus]PTQ89015.1 LysR family transcriptional regulator [Agitococcus lubricus]
MSSTFNLHDIATFLAIVDCGSLTQAAERLGLSKSIVSKRLKRLEEMLGVALLHRSTRGISTTVHGQAFHTRASAILQELEAAAEEITERNENLCGSIRIAAPVTFGTMYLGKLLFPFIAKHPRLDVAIHLDDKVEDIIQERYDLAIRISADPGLSLKARKLGDCKRVVVCSPEYAAKRDISRLFDDLFAHEYIGYSNIANSQLWGFLPQGEQNRVQIHSRFTANNGEMSRDAAIAGLGLAVMPLFIVAEALRTGQLIDAMPQMELSPIPIYAVYPPTRYVSKKVRLVIDHLCQSLGSNPPWEQDLPSTFS